MRAIVDALCRLHRTRSLDRSYFNFTNPENNLKPAAASWIAVDCLLTLAAAPAGRAAASPQTVTEKIVDGAEAKDAVVKGDGCRRQDEEGLSKTGR